MPARPPIWSARRRAWSDPLWGAAQASTAPRAFGYMVRGGVKDRSHVRGWLTLVPHDAARQANGAGP